MKPKLILPLPVKKALYKLGTDIQRARRQRRIPMALMAERAFISRQTLHKIERGNASVSLGAYATVLFVLGLTDKLADLADLKFDELGRQLTEARLPKRIRTRTPPQKQDK